MPETITLRAHLTGALNDVFEDATLGATWTCSLVCDIAALLIDYKEEGKQLFLDAFVTDKLTRITEQVPGSRQLQIGGTEPTEPGIRNALKRVAPLAKDGWMIYFSTDGTELEYGLFRDSGHPLNFPFDVTLRPPDVGDAKFIRLTKLSDGVIRVLAHTGLEKILHFTNATASAIDPEKDIADLSKVICSELDPVLSSSCQSYITGLLSRAIRESHGVLIAVARSTTLPKKLKDGVRLLVPLDIAEAVKAVLGDQEEVQLLQTTESVIRGMFACDGIVIFDRRGHLLAYNTFIKVRSATEFGGARHRAFKALENEIGKPGGIVACYIRSQDGTSKLRK